MLIDPPQLIQDPMTQLIANMNGNEGNPKRLQQGVFEIGHFSSDIILYGRNGDFQRCDFNGVPVYGVCDSPTQFLSLHGDTLEALPERICAFFTHVRKDPSNKGQGGGWRWHKWGEYIGTGTPQQEHLDDEDGFGDGIYVFHLHDIDWKPEPRNKR